MIEIDGIIISEDILEEEFFCDVASCRGMCCVEGDSGAPLLLEEVDRLEENFPGYEKYLTEKGREQISKQGFMVVDIEGDYTTPLVDGAQCAYSFKENGVTMCAVEKAFQSGESTFRKPISCHLYPIREIHFKNGSTGLNYHRWSVCASARKLGKIKGVKVYEALKEPLTERFGEEFYKKLETAAELLKNYKDK